MGSNCSCMHSCTPESQPPQHAEFVLLTDSQKPDLVNNAITSPGYTTRVNLEPTEFSHFLRLSTDQFSNQFRTQTLENPERAPEAEYINPPIEVLIDKISTEKKLLSHNKSLESQLNTSFTLPNYSTPEVLLTESLIGPFIYPENTFNSIDLINKPAICLENKAIYEGEWNNQGEKTGKGTQQWPDGSKYEGYWRFNKANGFGRLIHSDGDYYEGEWVDDKAHGFGVYLHANGSRYEGHWIADLQHGKGIERWPDGTQYEGFYEFGVKSGIGKFSWPDGSHYIGEFTNNFIEGKGTYAWADGRIYIGEWKENKMNGKGVFTWKDGRRYTGEYFNDKKHGIGVFEWPDGKRYEGSWMIGKQHGFGYFYDEKRNKKYGEWRNGKVVNYIE